MKDKDLSVELCGVGIIPYFELKILVLFEI